MRKLLVISLMCAALLTAGTPSSAESSIPLTGDDFLTRLANAFFHVRHGFSNSQISGAERSKNGILLSYSSSVFLTIQETPPPSVIKNISVVLMAQEEEKEKTGSKGSSPTDSVVFDNICRQVMYALHPSIKEDGVRKMISELGIDGDIFDGVQRSTRFERYKYIVKYNSNGMLIMVVSSL